MIEQLVGIVVSLKWKEELQIGRKKKEG